MIKFKRVKPKKIIRKAPATIKKPKKAKVRNIKIKQTFRDFFWRYKLPAERKIKKPKK
jgi:hypothetical protein